MGGATTSRTRIPAALRQTCNASRQGRGYGFSGRKQRGKGRARFALGFVAKLDGLYFLAYPSHCGLCTVPSKLIVVLYSSNLPLADAEAVFASKPATSCELMGLNERAASRAC